MIQIQTFVFNLFTENTFVLYDESKDAIVVDPGCYESHENKELLDFIIKHQLKVVKLINTHCHIDHILGNDFVKSTFKVPLIIHKNDEVLLRAAEAYAPSYGFTHFHSAEANSFVEEEDRIQFGNSSLDVLFVPGHSPGHIALINKEQNFCISGDVLFEGSIGRTDLPGGDYTTLINSIKDKMFALDEETTVHTGHGNTTTIGREKVYNPFCGINAVN